MADTKIEPEQSRELVDRARNALQGDRPSEAIVLLGPANAEGTLTPFARFLLADALRIVGRRAEADALYKSIPPEGIPEGHRWLLSLYRGQLELDRRDHVSALSFLREAAHLKPSSTVPWVLLGAAYTADGQFGEACRALENGLAAEGDVDEVYLNLGYNLRALEKYDEARAAFEKAIEIAGKEQYEEAEEGLRDVEAALQQRPGSA